MTIGFFDACRESKDRDAILKYANNSKRVNSSLDDALVKGKKITDKMIADAALEIEKKEAIYKAE